MDPFHFACPHCSSRLRVREKLYVGRQVDCPECGDTLLIVERGGELAVERVERKPPAVAVDGKRRPAQHEETVAKKADRVAGQRGTATPKTAASGAAAAPASTAVPPAPAFVRRIFADRRRWRLPLGATAALIAMLLAINHFARAPESPGASDKSSSEVTADQGAAGAKNAADDGTSAPGDGRPAPSPDKDEDGHDTRIAKVDETSLDDSDGPTTEDGALPPAGDGAVAGEPVADDRPIEPDFAPEPPAPPVRKIDLAASLKQPIARFDQPRSKPLEDILVSVAEMAGARLTVDRDELGPAAARLAEPMALKLENTTVGEILTGLLHPAGLSYRIEGDHLRVVRAEE